TSTGAATYAYTQLASNQSDLYHRFRFKVVSQQENVTLSKFRKAGGATIVSLYRSGSGKLCLRNDITTASFCSVSPSLGTWHTLQVHARVGTSGLTEVWLDGVKLTELARTMDLGVDPIGRVQVGNNQTGRTYDMLLDDVVVARTLI
ncbi:MAG: polysaccharide lyase, partial [Actinomycetota bacterium]|nr:polysaccharide lyase [Actinomycetota bacterium]